MTERVTIEMIGEGLREARQGIADLKTHIMEMEDRLTERMDTRFNQIDQQLVRIMDHLGIQ